MSSARGGAWLGYSTGGSREEVKADALGDRVLVLGRSSGPVAGLFAFALSEWGARPFILDGEGSVPPDALGPLELVDYRSALFDAFQLDGDGPAHGQLVSAAYASALGLSPDEEALLSAAMHVLAEQGDLASPAAVYDAVRGVPDFRGPYVDKLRGKLGSLRHMEAAQDRSLEGLMGEGSAVTFASAPYPLAGDVALAVFLAKAVHLLSKGARTAALVVAGAHRLFGGSPAHRLLLQTLMTRGRLLAASSFPSLLPDRVVGSFPVRVYSSEAWNSRRDWRERPSLPGTCTVCDDRLGSTFTFLPRYVRSRRRLRPETPLGKGKEDESLTRAVLEEVGSFELATRESVAACLSPRFLSGDVSWELDRLHRLGHLALEPKKDWGGPGVFSYTLTESGRKLLREMPP